MTPLDPGQLAAVVTSLEMTELPRPRPLPESVLRLMPWRAPDLGRYRALFRRVGAPWLWFSRLIMADAELTKILSDDRVRVFAVTDRGGIEVGMLELDFRTSPNCEIAYFGLVPELTGKGYGNWLMGHALALAWRRDVSRVWVHSCTLDHPAALAFYRRHGFRDYARAVETFADPRLIGVLASETAPQIPLLPTSA